MQKYSAPTRAAAATRGSSRSVVGIAHQGIHEVVEDDWQALMVVVGATTRSAIIREPGESPLEALAAQRNGDGYRLEDLPRLQDEAPVVRGVRRSQKGYVRGLLAGGPQLAAP